MKLFDRSTTLILSLLGILLLFLPKINLLSLGEKETAGIRVDDIVLFGTCMVIAWAHFALNKRFGRIEKRMLTIIAFSFFSLFLNRLFVAEGWLYVDASLFYCVRLAEYFVFFYIGAMSCRFFSTTAVIKAFFAWNVVLILLQKIGWIGQFTISGYVMRDTARVNGIGSFPSETGMFLVLVFCYLAFRDKEEARPHTKLLGADLAAFFYQSRIYWLFLLSTALVILSGSRIAVIALTVAFGAFMLNDLRSRHVGKWMIASLFLTLGIALGGWLIYNTAAIFERSAGLFSFNNLKLIELTWNHIELSKELPTPSVKFANYDLSWWMRIHKWMFVIKTYVFNPECWLQGLGPGCAGTALDGGLLRILMEYGLVGGLLFWRLFAAIARQSTALKWMVVAFAINMIFFDVYLAYKPMSLLFFVSGASWALQQQSARSALVSRRAAL